MCPALTRNRAWDRAVAVKTIATAQSVDKLNGYRHARDTAIVSWASKWRIFRTGPWYDWAYTDRS